MHYRILFTLCLWTALLVACQTPTKRETGSVIDRIAGGLISNQATPTRTCETAAAPDASTLPRR